MESKKKNAHDSEDFGCTGAKIESCCSHNHGKSQKPKLQSWEHKRMKAQQKNTKALNKLLWVTALTLVFMSVEIVGGYMANSIAIMSDAAHLISDVIGIGFSVVGLIIA
jgi:Co/Zn/Cd efflux system component